MQNLESVAQKMAECPKGPFTNYIIHRGGEGVSQKIILDYRGGGGELHQKIIAYRLEIREGLPRIKSWNLNLKTSSFGQNGVKNCILLYK